MKPGAEPVGLITSTVKGTKTHVNTKGIPGWHQFKALPGDRSKIMLYTLDSE